MNELNNKDDGNVPWCSIFRYSQTTMQSATTTMVLDGLVVGCDGRPPEALSVVSQTGYLPTKMSGCRKSVCTSVRFIPGYIPFLCT